jgi:hypothetical protein
MDPRWWCVKCPTPWDKQKPEISHDGRLKMYHPHVASHAYVTDGYERPSSRLQRRALLCIILFPDVATYFKALYTRVVSEGIIEGALLTIVWCIKHVVMFHRDQALQDSDLDHSSSQLRKLEWQLLHNSHRGSGTTWDLYWPWWDIFRSCKELRWPSAGAIARAQSRPDEALYETSTVAFSCSPRSATIDVGKTSGQSKPKKLKFPGRQNVRTFLRPPARRAINIAVQNIPLWYLFFDKRE